jgi:heme oxygenase (biliverdin-IX-beta and delta-forming)
MTDADRAELPERGEIMEFIEGFHSVVLATVDEAGNPDASYAPFVCDRRPHVYLYLSELAAHTANLRARRRASLLWLADEAVTPNPFARKRLMISCTASVVDRKSELWAGTMAHFADRLGPTVALLRQLSDFHLFRLRAESGTYVKGFAQAYRLRGEGLQVVGRMEGRPPTASRSNS